MSTVDLSNIKVSYGSLTVIDGLDVTVKEGEFFTLLGPSGCGKTTLLRVIAGFTLPKKGIVRFGDDDVTAVPPHRRNTGMVFQDYALFPHLSVSDNVAYGLRARKMPESEIKKLVSHQLETVGLAEFGDRYPNQLSGGQRQRVALARALVIKPRVLLMDEPLSALDAKLRHEMQMLIRSIQKDIGVTTIFVTHDQSEALAMSDHIALMKDGKFEQLATPETIFHRPRTVYAADFIGRANLLTVKLVEIRGETAVCDLLGAKLKVFANDCVIDDSVRLCIHHHEIQLNPVETGDQGILNGVITSVVFQGRHSNYEVKLKNGDVVKVECANGFGAAVHGVGDTVTVLISSDVCLVRE